MLNSVIAEIKKISQRLAILEKKVDKLEGHKGKEEKSTIKGPKIKKEKADDSM